MILPFNSSILSNSHKFMRAFNSILVCLLKSTEIFHERGACAFSPSEARSILTPVSTYLLLGKNLISWEIPGHICMQSLEQ